MLHVYQWWHSGGWELIDSEGEVHDMGREVDLVIVDQRTYNSSTCSLMSKKLLGEFEKAQTVNQQTVSTLILQWKTHSVIVVRMSVQHKINAWVDGILCVAYIAVLLVC